MEELKKILKQSKYNVFVIQKHVSSSGMTRKLSIYANTEKNRMINITKDIANVLDWSVDKNYYLIVRGCGMDMHFHTIYSLSMALYGVKNAYKLNYQTLW